MGPMTGRAAGFCAGYGVPGYMNPVPGRGFGMGFGRGRGFGGGGRGWRHRFYATGLTGWQRAAYGYPAFGGVPYAVPYAAPSAPAMPREQEVEMLKGQAEALQSELDFIKKRLGEIETGTAAE
jgi:hypothetical protein